MRPRVPSRGARRERRGRDKPERGEACGRAVDEIVELRRREAEGRVARREVADHAVGRGSPPCSRSRPASRRARARMPAPPRRRRNSRRGFRSPRGAMAASSSPAVSRPTIFATAARPAARPCVSSASATARTCVSRLRCARQVDARRPAMRSAAAWGRAKAMASTALASPRLTTSSAAQRGKAAGAARRCREVVAVEPRVQRGEGRADPGDGVADPRE